MRRLFPLSPLERKILDFVAGVVTATGKVPSQYTIAYALDSSRGSVKRAIDALKFRGEWVF